MTALCGRTSSMLVLVYMCVMSASAQTPGPVTDVGPQESQESLASSGDQQDPVRGMYVVDSLDQEVGIFWGTARRGAFQTTVLLEIKAEWVHQWSGEPWPHDFTLAIDVNPKGFAVSGGSSPGGNFAYESVDCSGAPYRLGPAPPAPDGWGFVEPIGADQWGRVYVEGVTSTTIQMQSQGSGNSCVRVTPQLVTVHQDGFFWHTGLGYVPPFRIVFWHHR